MLKGLNVIVHILTLGKERQSFIGARWVESILRMAPEKYKRQLALTVLSLSPHYFFRQNTPEHLSLSHAEFIEKEFERNSSSREKLCAQVLLPYLNDTQAVLDYGCGPGFLAKSVSRHVRKVYGVDLSKGVLECARIINGSSNTTYLHTTQLSEIEGGSLDLVYSFAVVQHVTDSVLKDILVAMHGKLKEGGKLIVHIVIDEEKWKIEKEWRRDISLRGRLKWKYGLNCFKRDGEDVRKMFESAGYTSVVIQPMKELCPEQYDDVQAQHLIHAVR